MLHKEHLYEFKYLSILLHATTLMNLENTLLSERGQSQGTMYWLTMAKGGGGGGTWEEMGRDY